MVGTALYLMQDSALFFPDSHKFENCSSMPQGTEALYFNEERFFYKNNSENLVVFYHGNAASGCAWGFLANFFDENNISFIISVYPGFSGDERSPSITKVKDYVDNLHDFTKNYQKVRLVGISMGSGAAAYHSTLGNYSDLFLISSFTSVSEIAKKQYPLYPVKFMLKDDFNVVEYLSSYEGRYIQMHGTKDEIVPLETAKILYNSVGSGDKNFVEIDATHNTMFSQSLIFNKLSYFLE